MDHGRPPVSDWRTDFDHYDPRLIADPYPVYTELRERCPVAHTDRFGGMAVLTRWAEVDAAAHDPGTFTSRRTIVSEVPTERRGLGLVPINLDPPAHTAYRRVVLPYFNPTRTAAWEEPIRQICTRLLEAIGGQDHCDGAVDYAQAIPSEIAARLLGLPVEEAATFRRWMHDLMEVGPTDPDVERATTREMLDYMAALVDRKRALPGDDVVSFLLDQQVDEVPLDDRNVQKMLMLLVVGAVDTTWSVIGSALLHLATHPEDRRRLVADPGLIPTATEELLRAYAPVSIARVATTDTELAGCPVHEGDWVLLAFPSINRDPSAFEHPDEVLIDREHNRHATFGLGPHRCLGSNLARLEINVALEMWLARHPEFSLDDAEPVTYSAGQVRGPRQVPLRLG